LAACLEEIKLGARIRVGNSARNRNSTAQENLDHDATDHGGQLQTTGIIRSQTIPVSSQKTFIVRLTSPYLEAISKQRSAHFPNSENKI
jgi:hypothetical protein